jgi:hypothetical protein
MHNASPVTSGRAAAAGRTIAHTIPQAVLASGLSRSLLYVAIGRGELRARKCGARTIILDSDLRRFLNRLPRFGGRTSGGARGPQKQRPS